MREEERLPDIPENDSRSEHLPEDSPEREEAVQNEKENEKLPFFARLKNKVKQLYETIRHPEKEKASAELASLDDNSRYESKVFNRIMHISTLVLMAALIVLSIIGYKKGIFSSQESLIRFVESLGPWAPLVFTIIQAVQVVIPILPGAIGCAVGVIAFGPWMGLVYNYVGICAGSIAAFVLSRRYGKPFVIRMVGDKNYEKYIGWTGNNKRYERLFAFLIFIPVAPDDILCYITGLTEMTLKKYVFIILTCKPFSISLYSLGLTAVMGRIWEWFKALGV